MQTAGMRMAKSPDGGQTWNSQIRVTDDDISTDLGSKMAPGISNISFGLVQQAAIPQSTSTTVL